MGEYGPAGCGEGLSVFCNRYLGLGFEREFGFKFGSGKFCIGGVIGMDEF